ncbi:CRP-like cAMP-binding protein [Arcticibacter tournemirensis]|nr:Crp/Fnr family transcriptional regulator [Arcticibacter tournemirensis]TQM52552.1 CRP-like cAMP-binding protein [Arcticibacter tournemirensis]
MFSLLRYIPFQGTFITSIFDGIMGTAIDLKDQVLKVCNLNEKEWDIFSSHIRYKEVQGNQFLLRQGNICDFVGFIRSGSFVYSRFLENGESFTTDFGFAGHWITDIYSRLNHLPSFLNIIALERSEVYLLQSEVLDELYIKIPKLERLGRVLTENAFMRIVRQTLNLQISDAKERYLQLIHDEPEIIQKIPLYHIANYLGIAPKSLSRIRKEIVTGNPK